jgi:hypothetical protein
MVSPPTGLSFGQFVKHCLKHGVRPPGSEEQGKKWVKKQFASLIKKGERQRYNYERDTSFPTDEGASEIESVLFGHDKSQRVEWRKEFWAALRRSRDQVDPLVSDSTEAVHLSGNDAAQFSAIPESVRDRPEITGAITPEERVPSLQLHSVLKGRSVGLGQRRSSMPAWNKIAQLVVGGAIAAQGSVHVAWFFSDLAERELPRIFQQAWTYGDIVFGFGGLIVGMGTMWSFSWARKAGIYGCLMGLLCAYLWFMDEGNDDASRVVVAFNVLSAPFSFSALCFYVLGWPSPEPDVSEETEWLGAS